MSYSKDKTQIEADFSDKDRNAPEYRVLNAISESQGYTCIRIAAMSADVDMSASERLSVVDFVTFTHVARQAHPGHGEECH